MDIAQVVGWVAGVGVAVSAITRLVGTVKSPEVSGVAPAWAWGALIGNVAWFLYAVFLPETKLIVGPLIWIAAGGYVLLRVHKEGRGQKRNLVFAAIIGVALLVLSLINPVTTAFVAGLITTSSFLPQTVRIWRTFDRKGVVPGAWAIVFSLSVMWFIYGLALDRPELWISNLINTVLTGLILIGAAVAKRKEKALVS
jgi:MtN3 and saliva related transmembrane protein